MFTAQWRGAKGLINQPQDKALPHHNYIDRPGTGTARVLRPYDFKSIKRVVYIPLVQPIFWKPLTHPVDRGRGGPCARPDLGLGMVRCRCDELRFQWLSLRGGTAPYKLKSIYFAVTSSIFTLHGPGESNPSPLILISIFFACIKFFDGIFTDAILPNIRFIPFPVG